MALPLPRRDDTGVAQQMLFLLLSAADLQSEDTFIKRIERLSLVNGGENIAVIFLLREGKEAGIAMTEFLQLQTRSPSIFPLG